MQYREVLKSVFGHDSFREGQEEAVQALLAGRDVLAVMPTGSGKSVCYQLPALVKTGIALVISPLISLMKDQVAALKACGVAAAYINSSLTPGQQAEALRRAAAGAYKIIYVAPERLETPGFTAFVRQAELNLIAVDEAHCVSQWGQEFRPGYLRILAFLRSLPNCPPIAACTATATARVREDIIRLLGLRDPQTVITGYDRANLYFSVVKPNNKYVHLSRFLENHREDAGIIYCSTRKTVESVTAGLKAEGFSAARYHAGLRDEERARNQEDFRFDRVRIMVATNAFGMGIDKSDVRFVVHYNMPASMEAYYQEAGRAGRDGLEAQCIMLYSGQDVITGRWMIEHGDPNPELSMAEQQKVRALELERLKQITFYATSKRCLREQILQYFGEKTHGGNCGRCSHCLGEEFIVDCSGPLSIPGKAEWAAAPAAAGARAAPRGRELTAREAALYENLKTLRMLIANHIKSPAFVVLSNASLTDMVRRMPKSREEFMQVSGIGEIKCRHYCDCFLQVLKEGKEPNEAFLVYLDGEQGEK